METKSIVNALAAIAQESRLLIYRTLVQAGPTGMAAGKISEVTRIAPSSLSFHLKELTYADMVTSRNEGRFVIYSANYKTMNQVLGYLTENCCGGNQCSSVSIENSKEGSLV
ncbi:MAG: metalloregulator ArsR/SmtB family transcription factor [Methylovulum sp.]|nr:metalloregulator ArsR/SmtB family transcription factor [Methylovulum sp.]